MDATTVKQQAFAFGAHGCGIAGLDRFADAPKGFHPTDVFAACKSVVVMFRRLPLGPLLAGNPASYTHAAHKMYEELDNLSMDMLQYCQDNGVLGAIVPADNPYTSWDEERMHGSGILSLKHAAANAGLGILGKSGLLINRQYGNMVYLGAVLLDALLDADPLVTDFACPPNCNRCFGACPGGALDGRGGMEQKLCRPHCFRKIVGRNWTVYNCSHCRKQCLLRDGVGTRA